MPSDESRFSVLDLLDLPAFERQVWLVLSRRGPAGVETLTQQLDCDPKDVEKALANLKRKGRVLSAADDQWDVALGHIGRHTTLPVSLWPALFTTDRIYSEQEIATLRTAIPMLQFARAKLSEFTDHGPNHGLRVKSFATQLSYVLDLTNTERHLLRAGALFHDIGNVVDRERHNIISQKTVEKLTTDGKLPFSPKGAELVGLLCRWHRGEFDSTHMDTLRGEPIRTGLLASVLRVADAMDIDHRRSDYQGMFRQVLEFYFPENLPHWTSLEQVRGVRIRCNPSVNLQVFTRGQPIDNLQINMLREDLASTHQDWKVMEIDAEAATWLASSTATRYAEATAGGRALIVFPFEAHSLVMAALSRKHLTTADCIVESLCYPDTVDGPTWLWNEVLLQISPQGFDRLVIIGDRPDAAITPQMLDTVRLWQERGVTVSVLNRHEANWPRLPKLLELGAEVILGGDWAYFWGDAASELDLVWGRIGALCTRDPTQSTVGVTAEEEAVTQGLLNVVYKTGAEPPADDAAGWLAVVEPILNRIANDDRAYFACKASGFAETCAKAAFPGRVEGQVVVFDQTPGEIPQTYYWIMEATIEDHGRVPERGIRFNVPYAIATWPDGDAVELLAINHWREEKAIPVRLLYPCDLGPPPQGNESTIRVRMSAKQAAAVIPALSDACNRA
ncbi:HD domain-containing protein [Chloroflexota bacterium]